MSLTLAQMPSEQHRRNADTGAAQPASGVPHLGLQVAPASEVSGAGGQGVVVTAVDPDGPAAEQGFQTGNVILDVGGKAVANAGDVRKALTEAKAQGKHRGADAREDGRRHAVRGAAARQCVTCFA